MVKRAEPGHELTTLVAGDLSITVDSFGAQLMSMMFAGGEYLWQRDPRFWGKSAPTLFPNIGVVRDDRVETAQGTAHLRQHGVARWLEHALVERTATRATYLLESSEETLRDFPFHFALETSYTIVPPATVVHTFRVVNTGAVDLPFNIGSHPAYNLPMPGAEGERFEDYEVRFTRPWSPVVPVVLDDTKLMDYSRAYRPFSASDRLALDHSLFDHDNLMFEHVPGSTIELVGTKSGRGLRFDFADFPYLAIWSPAGEAPFLSVEPWTGHATAIHEDDVFEHKAGTIILRPGQADVRSFAVTVLETGAAGDGCQNIPLNNV